MNPSLRWRRGLSATLAVLVGLLASLLGPARPAAAASYVPISGAGSTFSSNAVSSWITDVAQLGMPVSYQPVGSAAGREDFRQRTVDFAVSDLPYGTGDPLPTRGFAYMPGTAGATTFAYNLSIGGQPVTNLRLSGDTIAKIFTGVITEWNDPAIAADNPGLDLPAIGIVPVVPSDSSGTTAQFTQWMLATEGQYWTAYCAVVNLNPCAATPAYPVLAGSAMVGQPGDVGVAGYVAQPQAAGAIGFITYPYALASRLPVAKVLNRAGYYTQPTAGHVGVSLLNAQINMDQSNPATYLTADLSNVYADTDLRTYELSWYSYLIVPTTLEAPLTAAKGFTLADFGRYAICGGQQRLGALGYSPLPLNLVEAGFAQLQRIPGSQVSGLTLEEFLSQCFNPTFSTDGTNTLAATDPMPAACDRQGPTQCATPTIDVQGETIDVNIPQAEGVFTMTVSGTPVQLSDAVLSADNATFESTGQLGAVTIADARHQSQPGWSVSGQVAEFSGDGHTFGGRYLGWTPMVTIQDAAGDVIVGPAVAPGTDPGLAGGGVLAAAAATRGLGTAVLGATLDLRMPSSTPTGLYSTTLTITAVESAG
jgi:phosphate transport system substrate-binding protein